MKRQMKRMLFFFSVTFLFFVYRVEAQETSKTPPIWLARAQVETSQLAELAFGYSKFNQASLYGQIGEAWWKTDESRGREWLQKAIDLLAFVPLQESVEERKLHLGAIRNVLRNVGSRDQAMTKRLLDAMNAISKLPSSTTEQQSIGNSLLETAKALIDFDPVRAKELGLLGLRADANKNLLGFLAHLRAKDGRVADAFFTEALTLARTIGNAEILDKICLLIAITEDHPGYQQARVPVAIQALAVKAIIERVATIPSSPEAREPYCKFVTSTVIWHRQRLATHFPAQTSLVQQAIETCQQAFQANSVEGRFLKEAATGNKLPDDPSDLFDEIPKSFEGWLALARKTTVPSERVQTLLRAAQQSIKEEKPEEGLSILENMTAEERRLVNSWENWLSRLTFNAMLKQLKNNEYGKASKLMENLPERLRTAAVIECLQERFSGDDEKDSSSNESSAVSQRVTTLKEEEKWLLVEWLKEARQRLPQAEFTSDYTDKCIQLVSFYEMLQPEDTLSVFGEAVRAMNRIDASAKSKDSSNAEGATPVSFYVERLPQGFVKTSFEPIRVVVNELDAKDNRMRFHLGLLKDALAFHQMESAANMKATEKFKPAAKAKP